MPELYDELVLPTLLLLNTLQVAILGALLRWVRGNGQDGDRH